MSSTSLASTLKSASTYRVKTHPAPTKSLLTLSLVALIYFRLFSPNSSNRFKKQVHFLVMSLICVNLCKSCILSKFQLSCEQTEGNIACFTALLWESNKIYLCESTFIKDLECVYTCTIVGTSSKCWHPLSHLISKYL